MKKLLLLSIILLSVISANAQFKQGVGFEYYTSNKTKADSDMGYVIFNKGDFATLYKLQYQYHNFKTEALTSIYMNKGDSYTFSPTHSEFTISIAYHLSNIKIKVEHQCVHPIITDKDKHRVKMYGGHTKVGVYYNFN